jgi:hypothetical protein
MGKVTKEEDVILQSTIWGSLYFILRLFNNAILTAGVKLFNEMVRKDSEGGHGLFQLNQSSSGEPGKKGRLQKSQYYTKHLN